MLSFTIRSVSFVCILLVVCRCVVDCRHDPKWIKTGALDRWGQQQQQQKQCSRENYPNDGPCKAQTEPLEYDCPPAPPVTCTSDVTDDQRLFSDCYRKLMQTLFARDTLLVDPAGEDFLTVSLSLRISSRQLEKLRNESISAREHNSVVLAILEQSANGTQISLSREKQHCERLYEFLMQLFESRVLLPLVLVITGCFAIRMIAHITRLKASIVLEILVAFLPFVSHRDA